MASWKMTVRESLKYSFALEMSSLSLMLKENFLKPVVSLQAMDAVFTSGMSLPTNMVYGSMAGVWIFGDLPVCPRESVAMT